MGIIRIVRRSPETFRHRTAQQECINPVIDIKRLVLIKRQHDQRLVVIERRIRKERHKPVFEPIGSKVDVRVVSIIHQVRRDKVPLRDDRCVEVGCEVVKVSNQFSASGDGGDGVKNGVWVVFAHVVGIWGC